MFSVTVFSPHLVSAQREGLLSRIENPRQYFEDERRNWIGQTIYFLKDKPISGENPYFDWCYDPFDMVHSKPNPEDLMFTYGVFKEVWLGQIHLTKPGRDYWRIGFFWKVRLTKNNRIIYFWDDGESGITNFGFVADIEEAKKHIGETIWNQSRDILYLPDDSGVIPLKNLQPVILTDVQWGEFGNFPLKFILETKKGEKGYYLEKNYARFIKEWHTSDPHKRYPHWSYFDWKMIEKRKLFSGMSPDMVILSWGKPSKVTIEYDKKGVGSEIWLYKGVRKTTYYLRFKGNRLVRVWWKEKKENE